MDTPTPGANTEKALRWVQSHEGCEDATIKWDPWVDHFIEVTQGSLTEDEFTAFSTRCFDLFATPVWASEWA